MKRKPEQPGNKPRKKLSTSTLAIGLIVTFAFSILMGITGGARGFGSVYPQINLVAKPFLCPRGEMSYSKSVSEVGSATYYSATWSCQDAQSGEKKQLDSTYVFVVAGVLFGLVNFVAGVLMIRFYWNSSIGPARNGGPELW